MPNLRGLTAEEILVFSEGDLLDYLDELLAFDDEEEKAYWADEEPNGIDRLYSGMSAEAFVSADQFLPS